MKSDCSLRLEANSEQQIVLSWANSYSAGKATLIKMYKMFSDTAGNQISLPYRSSLFHACNQLRLGLLPLLGLEVDARVRDVAFLLLTSCSVASRIYEDQSKIQSH